MYVFPLLYILFNTILPDLFILLILGVKRYLVLNCLSLVTAYHIYLPSVLLLLWNVFITGGKFFHWIVCLCLLNFWNPWYILKLNSLLIICVANIFVTCLYYTLLFFFFGWTEVLNFNADWPIFSFLTGTLPLFMLFGLPATYLGQETHRDKTCSGFWVHLSGFPLSHLAVPYESISTLVTSRRLFLIHLLFSCLRVRQGLSYRRPLVHFWYCCEMEDLGIFLLPGGPAMHWKAHISHHMVVGK